MEDLIKKILEATTLAEHEAASNACIEYLNTATDEESKKIKEAIRQKAKRVILESVETRKKALEYINRIKTTILP